MWRTLRPHLPPSTCPHLWTTVASRRNRGGTFPLSLTSWATTSAATVVGCGRNPPRHHARCCHDDNCSGSRACLPQVWTTLWRTGTATTEGGGPREHGSRPPLADVSGVVTGAGVRPSFGTPLSRVSAPVDFDQRHADARRPIAPGQGAYRGPLHGPGARRRSTVRRAGPVVLRPADRRRRAADAVDCPPPRRQRHGRARGNRPAGGPGSGAATVPARWRVVARRDGAGGAAKWPSSSTPGTRSRTS